MMHAREKSIRHSSWEADEQGGAIRRGAGGAKGGDQRECEPAQHAPDTEPGERDPGAGAHTESSKQKEEGKFTALLHHLASNISKRRSSNFKRMPQPAWTG